MDHFKRLPDEMLLKVFSYLDAKSLVKCRHVSKRFKLWVDDLALKELAIKGYETDYYSCCSWYHTGGSVARSDFVCVHTFNVQANELDQEIFHLFERLPLNLAKLQRIKIATFEAFSDNFRSRNNGQKLVRILNGFAELEHLEMNVVLDLGKETVLRLPILRVLLVNTVSHHDLVIEAPRLAVLCCRMGLQRVKVATPETVKQIELQYGFGNLEGYRSVEMFRCKCPERLETSIIDQILEFCPELRQLHIEMPDHQGTVQYTVIKELMHHLLAQKDRLKRKNLDAYLFGIKLYSDKEFEEQVPTDHRVLVADHQPVFALPFQRQIHEDVWSDGELEEIDRFNRLNFFNPNDSDGDYISASSDEEENEFYPVNQYDAEEEQEEYILSSSEEEEDDLHPPNDNHQENHEENYQNDYADWQPSEEEEEEFIPEPIFIIDDDDSDDQNYEVEEDEYDPEPILLDDHHDDDHGPELSDVGDDDQFDPEPIIIIDDHNHADQNYDVEEDEYDPEPDNVEMFDDFGPQDDDQDDQDVYQDDYQDGYQDDYDGHDPDYDDDPGYDYYVD